MSLQPLHLSHSYRHADGGIAFAVSDLMAAQQKSGVFARWLAAERFHPLHRDQQLYQSVTNLKPTVVHCHGLWRSQTRIAIRLIQSGLPLLISPHGMLDPWAMAHSSFKKEIVWRLWEGASLKSVMCMHALCDAEAVAIQQRLPDCSVAVIPNGVSGDHEVLQPRTFVPWHEEIPEDQHVLLFLGRFHQKKGIEPLITAWQAVHQEARKAGWWLVFVGFGDEGKLLAQLKTFPIDHCRAYGPVFGSKKVASYQYASSFILPSYSEGLPMAALEAMSHGLPCLLSSSCNLPEAYQAGAAWPAEPDISQLIIQLKALFALRSHELSSIGDNGRRLVSTRFQWDQVAEKTVQVYQWMLGETSKPMFVRDRMRSLHA